MVKRVDYCQNKEKEGKEEREEKEDNGSNKKKMIKEEKY